MSSGATGIAKWFNDYWCVCTRGDVVAEKREKRRIKRPRPEKQPIPRGCPPRWAWFFGGLLIGIFGAFLFYLYELAPSQLEMSASSTLAENNENSTDALHYENYEFYSNLPKSEVKVVETEDDTAANQDAAAINALQAPQQAAENTNLRLQVGSFRDIKVAQGLQKHLSSMNIQATIEQATVNGLSWHRVRIGPFSSEQALEQIKATLDQQKIPFSVVE
jgi:cell division protein FtsN